MNILITGGTGYIGSHTAVSLLLNNHTVVLYDSLFNSSPEVIGNLEKISGKKVIFIKGDIRNTDLIIQTLKSYKIDAVIHLAGLKAVEESVVKPIDYFSNNVQGTISLLLAMLEVGVKTLVFSSSATIYGSPQYLPIDELHPMCPINPYGRSKVHIEEMLVDVARSDDSWRIVSLRYFNPVGAHDSGLIGENPNGAPNNLMPLIMQVVSGKRAELIVFGNDYPTSDGTGVRDYIHIMDLVEGHLSALNYLNDHKGLSKFNLGTGKGYSVLEMLQTFERICGKSIPYKITVRRPGDIAICYAKVDKAAGRLCWVAKRNIEDMCASVWQYYCTLR